MPFFKFFSKPARVYLDFASSTPLDAKMLAKVPRIPVEVLAANPSALHREGVLLKRYLVEARARVAKVLDAHSDEIIFTASATESDNLALAGMLREWHRAGIAAEQILVYTSDIEHAAVSERIAYEIKHGVQHRILPTIDGVVDPKHIVIPDGVRAVLISVMYVNNQIGTVQPIADVAKRVRKLRKEYPDVQFVFHTDATQAPAHLSLRIPSLGVDMLTLGATKLYCHKGVGVLYKKRGISLVPIMRGGGQEQGLRPGTEPVVLIHEFSYALKYAQDIREQETVRITVLRDYFEAHIQKNFPEFKITAPSQPRSPHISHVAVPNFDSELLVIELDARGIAVSAKSACQNDLPSLPSREQAGEDQESPIVEKLYGKNWSAVRFSFGRTTTKKDLNRGIIALKNILEKYDK